MAIKKIKPQPGQESVWDYPRPPVAEATTKHIRILTGGITLASTNRSVRVLETSHPPVYYLPMADIRMEYLTVHSQQSFCEFKGAARYYNIQVGNKEIQQAGWYYPNPNERFALLKDHVAFYPQLMDACYVNDELVQPQPGGFYGGWITSDVVGPFKGGPGTWGW